MEKPCKACAFCYMEPDSDLICGHKESGSFGLSLIQGVPTHCGPEKIHFKQHSLRTPQGGLQSQVTKDLIEKND